MNKLCLLDLDHTIIYGSYANSEKVVLLFQYNEYLKVYKRPYVEQFIQNLKQLYDDIIVFTTAKNDYALQICEHLSILPKQVLSRKDCLMRNENYYKKLNHQWYKTYDQIDIIDDSPNVWLIEDNQNHNINFLIPREFRGEPNDDVLKTLLRVDDNSKGRK